MKRAVVRTGYARRALPAVLAGLFVLAGQGPSFDGLAHAQDAGQAGNRYLRLDAVQTSEVPKGGPLLLFTSFLDKYGKPVAVPPDAKWVVSFDGEPATGDKKVLQRRQSDRGLNLVVVVGALATLEGEPFDAVKEASASLIAGLRKNDRSAAVSYTDIVEDTVNLSPQHEDSISWLNERGPEGVTPPLYEAIEKGLSLFPADFESFGPNRAMLVLTDGADKDDSSASVVKDRINAIQALADDLNVRITVIAVDIAGLGQFEQVSKLGSTTGGIARKAATPAEVRTLVDNYRSEILGQYVIEIAPKGLDGGKDVGFKVDLDHGGQSYSTDTVMRSAPEVPSNLLLYLAIGGGGLLALILLVVIIRAIVRAMGRNREEEVVVVGPDLVICRQCNNQIPMEWKVCQYCEALPHYGRLKVLAAGEGNDDLIGQVLFIKESQTNIGAAENNHIMLPVSGVSKRHAGVQVQDGRFELADYGSMNGTFIEGSRISKQFLKDGDELQFGPVKVEFRLKK